MHKVIGLLLALVLAACPAPAFAAQSSSQAGISAEETAAFAASAPVPSNADALAQETAVDVASVAHTIAVHARMLREPDFGAVCGMYLRIAGMQSATGWLIACDTQACVTCVYWWDGSAWAQLYAWRCTPGADETPTKLGVYTVGERNEVSYSLDYTDQFFYYIQYSGYYLFHSVTFYPEGGPKDVRLGYRLSHGCVRLSVANAKWLYENIPSGTTAYLY